MDIGRFLEANVKPVTGCTEPAAIAFAASAAFHSLSGCIPPDFSGSCEPVRIGKIKKIEITTDRNVYKNAANVPIPGTEGHCGPETAAAAGIFLRPQAGLDVFSGMTPEIRAKVRVLSLTGRITCCVDPEIGSNVSPDIRVAVTQDTGRGFRTGVVHIAERHDRIAEIRVDDEVCYTCTGHAGVMAEETPPDSLVQLIRIAESMDQADTDEVFRGVEMNMNLARMGMYRTYGLGLGKNLRKILANQKGQLSIIDTVRITAAVAADARMGGAPYPVMSTAGSGNQGITALIPLGVVGAECSFSKEEICRAALISHMVTMQADRYSGHLSALCGCSIKAGIGAAAGVCYLIGGGADEITTAINLMVANVTGTICDGAKPGCSLKIATAAGIATECAFLAVGGMKIPVSNGIIQKSAAGTIRMLEKISRAMIPVDATIVKILESKPQEYC